MRTLEHEHLSRDLRAMLEENHECPKCGQSFLASSDGCSNCGMSTPVQYTGKPQSTKDEEHQQEQKQALYGNLSTLREVAIPLKHFVVKKKEQYNR